MKRIWNLRDKLNKDNKRYGTTGHAPGTWQAVLSLISMPNKTGSIVNAGCGRFTPDIPNYVVQHCDIRPNRKGKTNYTKCDLNEGLPYATRMFDGVIAMELIEHLENPHYFLREATRVATEWIILTYPNNESIEARNHYQKTGSFPWFSETHVKKNGHISPIFSWQVRHILSKLDWGIEDTKYNNPITKEITVQRLIPMK